MRKKRWIFVHPSACRKSILNLCKLTKKFYDLIAKNKPDIHIPSVINVRRFAPNVYLPRIVVPNIKNGRNSHFIDLQTDLSRSVLLFECELRLLTYGYFAITAILKLIV